MTREQQPENSGAGYPAEERGRRIVWRTVAMGVFAVFAGLAWWLADQQEWNFKLTLAAVAVPYWLAVTTIWRHHGPFMPGLHSPRS